MASQAPIGVHHDGGSRYEPADAPVGVMVDSLAEFGGNILTLAELQAKLTACEVKACAHKATVPVAVLACAGVLVLGSLPVLLEGLAAWLATELHWTAAQALLAAGGGALALGVVAAIGAAVGVRKSLGCISRSREELSRNIAWVKAVIAQPRNFTTRPMH